MQSELVGFDYFLLKKKIINNLKKMKYKDLIERSENLTIKIDKIMKFIEKT